MHLIFIFGPKFFFSFAFLPILMARPVKCEFMIDSNGFIFRFNYSLQCHVYTEILHAHQSESCAINYSISIGTDRRNIELGECWVVQCSDSHCVFSKWFPSKTTTAIKTDDEMKCNIYDSLFITMRLSIFSLDFFMHAYTMKIVSVTHARTHTHFNNGER